MHILLIDDSSSTRSLLRTLINSGQTVRHEISEAASGEEALQKVGSGEIAVPDLVIMDINMGGMSGYELCREFRQKHGTESDVVPYIIIITANEGVDVINQALDCGANDYMPKPVNVKILQVRLRVAERLLSHAQGGGSPTASGKLKLSESRSLAASAVPAAATNAGPSPLDTAIANADVPIALVTLDGTDTFPITYANAAMSTLAPNETGPLTGRSLAELEAWTPEFLAMINSFVLRGAPISYVPLWSKVRQPAQVHLSFYPVTAEDGMVRSYLVLHQL